MLAIDLRKFRPKRKPVKLLQQFATLRSSAQSQLADQLFVASLLAGRAAYMAQQFLIRHVFKSRPFEASA